MVRNQASCTPFSLKYCAKGVANSGATPCMSAGTCATAVGQYDEATLFRCKPFTCLACVRLAQRLETFSEVASRVLNVGHRIRAGLLACAELRERSLVTNILGINDVDLIGIGSGSVLRERQGRVEQLQERFESRGPAGS